jgi:hypothetical protein
VQDWLTRTNPQEDYILILDADMIMLKPFDPVKMGVAPGEHCCVEKVALAGVLTYLTFLLLECNQNL